jgi:hypothetical protein
MIGWLIKAVRLLPRRCKGVPHTFAVYESDPVELWATLRCFINDRNGGFVTAFVRLPVRAHYLDYVSLTTSEKEMVINRMVMFVDYWSSNSNNSEDLDILKLFQHPVDTDEIDAILCDPPKEYYPHSKF